MFYLSQVFQALLRLLGLGLLVDFIFSPFELLILKHNAQDKIPPELNMC